MKLKLEIDVPDFNWVDAPTAYWTPIVEVKEKLHVELIKDLIEYLQRLPDRHWIIEADHQHVRHPFCRELVRDRLRFIPENQIWWVGEKLSHFLMGFRDALDKTLIITLSSTGFYQMEKRSNSKHFQ